MEIILAKSAGYCYGVKRAVDMAFSLCGQKNVVTLGPVIHNKVVVKELEEKGIFSKSLDEILEMPKGTKVLIRSHGVGKDVYSKLLDAECAIIDATCSHVKRIHELVDEYSSGGHHIIIVGDPGHAEVIGIAGWVNGDYTIISSKEEAEKFSLNAIIPVCLVSQTTFNVSLLKELVEIINKKGYDVVTLDTVCSATNLRQKEVEQIAKKVDAMIVIGDRGSSNTRKLFDIAKGKCKTYFLQTKEDFDPNVIHSIGTVGITAGASTPDKLIREVMLECQK